MTVGERSTVNDFGFLHVGSGLGCLLLIDPRRVRAPFGRVDNAVRAGGRGDARGVTLELLGERLVIEKDVRIVVLAIEAI